MKMRVLVSAVAFACVQVGAAVPEPVDYVVPLMGTDSEPALSAGNVYPDISRPWGMHSWTPQTGPMANNWFYGYRQTKLRGFRQTHQPSPWMGDYGAFAVFPMTGAPVFDEEKRASWFSHKAETAKPHYYRAYLADYDTTFEMTPTVRAAMMRVTYPQTDSPLFLVDLIASGREKGTLKVDKAARGGDPHAIEFPRGEVKDHPFDFTFSGLKSAVLNHINMAQMKGEEINVADLAASFQRSVTDSLVTRTILCAESYGIRKVAIAGGVSANTALREAMKEACLKRGMECFYPEPVYCTDNAAMIASAAYFEYLAGRRDTMFLNAEPNLKLGER